MTPRDDLQETPLGKADFLWYTEVLYLKNENDKYCADYVIVSPF